MKSFLSQSARIWLVCLLPVIGTSACHESKVYQEHTVRRQDQAASVTVSTTLVAHWDDYVSILAPKFVLKSGDQALSKVIPQTMAIEEKVLRMFGASLGISARDYEIARPDVVVLEPPDAGTTDEEEEEEEEDDGEADDDEETADDEEADNGEEDDDDEEEDPTAESEEEAGEVPGRPSASALPGLPAGSHTLGQDPMLQYLAATALYQEVQLLNRYIENAALRRDYKPFVVRLQIGVTPYARNMPYDVYATVSFFGDRSREPQAFSIDASRRPEEPPARQAVAKSLSPVLVTPLLVTDNLEGALKSRAVNTIRDFMVALSVLTGKVDVDAKLTAYTDQLSHVLGTDLNSLLTIAQVNDNSVRIRLGAARQATAGHAIIPRTHNVTLLVLVPNEQESRKLHVEAATELRHATDGDALDTPSLKSRRKEIHKKLKRYSEYVYSSHPSWAHYCYERLRSFDLHEYDAWTARSDFAAFEQALYSSCETTTASSTLWMELVELHGSRPYARASFELPEAREPRLPKHRGQELVLTDNSKTGKMTATLYGGKDLKKTSLSATLELWVKRTQESTTVERDGQQVTVNVYDCKKPVDSSQRTRSGGDPRCPIPAKPVPYVTYPIVLAATDIKVQGGSHGSVTLTFPSIAKREFGEPLVRSPRKDGVPAPKLTLRLVEDSPWRDDRDPDCQGEDEMATTKSSRSSFDYGEPRSRDHVDCQTYEQISYVALKKDPTKAKFQMTSGAKVIRSSKHGRGQLDLSLSTKQKDELQVTLKVAGAQVTKITDDATGTKLKSRTVKIKKGKGKRLIVHLANLSAKFPVIVQAKATKDGKEGAPHSPLSFPVEPLPLQRSTGSK